MRNDAHICSRGRVFSEVRERNGLEGVDYDIPNVSEEAERF